MKKLREYLIVFINMILFIVLVGLGNMEGYYIQVIFVSALIFGIFVLETKIAELKEQMKNMTKKTKKTLNSNKDGHLYDWSKDEF